MSTFSANAELRCTLWIHDEHFSKDEVVFNSDLFPRGAVKPGDLVAITALKVEVASHDFIPTRKGFENPSVSLPLDPSVEECKSSKGCNNMDSRHDIDLEKRYLFAIKEFSKDLKVKHPGLEISVAKHIADVFGFKYRSNVLLNTTNAAMATASHVELSFKDEYLARSDMWRLTISELSNKTVYKGQKIVFIGTIKAQVTCVYVTGKKVQSAFFSSDTKPVFRSESARFVLFIQMSREMWDFDSEGSGEIMFTKAVNGFLPALFKRWASLKARHLVSIVLFTRVEYDTGLTTELALGTLDNVYHTGIRLEGSRKPYKDFYRVVVSEMASGEWTTILYQLKREFRHFRHDISMHRLNSLAKCSDSVSSENGMGSVPGTRVEAEPTLAIHGNFLEAINLASTQYAHDYIDRDLLRTGISIIIITPGAGLFEVDHETLRITTENLVSSGIGIDLVCLPKIPLHSVPLFRYRNPKYIIHQDGLRMKSISSLSTTPHQGRSLIGNYSTFHESLSPSKSSTNGKNFQNNVLSSIKVPNEWNFAVPHWLDVSFWTGAPQDIVSTQVGKEKGNGSHAEFIRRSKDFAVRCKMYELEMSSITNDGMVEISVAPLPNNLRSLPMPTENADFLSVEFAVIQRRKTHSGLSEPVLGYSRVVASKTLSSSNKKFYERLTTYDERSSLLSDPRENGRLMTGSEREMRVDYEESTDKTHAGDLEALGTSFKEENEDLNSLAVTGIAISAQNRHFTRPDDERPTSRKDNEGIKMFKASTRSSPRPPRISRQISLGNRGFGIAASKAAAAEVEVVNASAKVSKNTTRVAMIPRGSTPSSKTAQYLPSSHQDKSLERPNSAQSSIKSSKGIVRISGSDTGKTLPSHPIDIKTSSRSSELQSHPHKESHRESQAQKRSLLGSLHDGGDIHGYVTESPSIKLKPGDDFKASKLKLEADSISTILTTLSPTTALSPWLTVLNPSNPTIGDNIASQYKRWQHVFPRPLVTKAMKWKSLCSPASVPLTTEYFPTKDQLETEYHQKPYNVSQDFGEDLTEVPKTREEFLRELISLRLSQGFQIVVGPAVAEAFGQKFLKIGNPFNQENLVEEGSSIFMSMGNIIHRISCVNGTEIEVNGFIRKSALIPDSLEGKAGKYRPAVRTTLASDYVSREIVLGIPQEEYNWNYVDSFVAGQHEEMSESLRFWRARFVLIPVLQQNPLHARKWEDTEEETRLEGIKALTQMWQRHRYIPPSERQFHSLPSRKVKDQNPLDIVYQTQDPSVVVNAELETLSDTGNGFSRRGQLLSESEPFRKANLNVGILAEAIQAPVEKGGVRMQNRRWHFRLHYNCFIGSDMTTWLLENFEDIESRVEAEKLGDMLMIRDEERKAREKEVGKDTVDDKDKDKDMGIFVHVEKRHLFRDGQFFYQIVGEYAKPRPETRGGWPFGSRRRDASVPSTPITDTGPRDFPKADRTRLDSATDEKASSSGTTTPTLGGGKRPKVTLSRVMKYDVDPRKRSYRPERINLHYDRLHNPDNCYHVRIDWMNVTAKLIEDAVQSWATTADRYGLRLIEVPMGEACSITSLHPFKAPYFVQLVVPPPDLQPPSFFDATSLTPQVSAVRHYYQKAILKKYDFVLDVEAARNFPANVEVTYSWGSPDYRYSQYIHRSGVMLAQITDEGNFLLLANKLYNNRATASRELERFVKLDRDHVVDRPHRMNSGAYDPIPGSTTPISSPVIRASSHTIGDSGSSPVIRVTLDASTYASTIPPMYLAQGLKSGPIPMPEQLIKEFEKFCTDTAALGEFYQEVLERSASPNATPPGAGPKMPLGMLPESNIPMLGLPACLLSREGSPSPIRVGGVPSMRGRGGAGRDREVSGLGAGAGVTEETEVGSPIPRVGMGLD